MFECVSLNNLNINNFKRLNKLKNNFNVLNEDFFQVYNSSNFAQKMFLRRRVKLLKDNSNYIGYIWAELSDNNFYNINAFNVIETHLGFERRTIPYKLLIKTLRKKCIVNYLCENNSYNFDILNNLGFVKKEGTLILSLNLDANICLYTRDGIDFQILKIGVDEQKRCDIQNEIFKNDTRIPLSIEDIYLDEAQDYYLDNGAVFIKKEDKPIGYGQIIIEDSIPTIVNFGIVREYRGKGYSKILLSYLLKTIKLKGFNHAKIKVKSTNVVALNLYKAFNFKVKKEIYNWQLKT